MRACVRCQPEKMVPHGAISVSTALLLCSAFIETAGEAPPSTPTYTFIVGVVGGGHDAVAAIARTLVPTANAAGRKVAVASEATPDGGGWFVTGGLPERNTSVIMDRINSVYGKETDLLFAQARFPIRSECSLLLRVIGLSCCSAISLTFLYFSSENIQRNSVSPFRIFRNRIFQS